MTLEGFSAEACVSGDSVRQIALRALEKQQSAAKAAYAKRELAQTALPM